MRNFSEIDPDMIELALQMARAKLADAVAQRTELDDEIENWERKIERYENLVPKRTSTNGSSDLFTNSGRVKHGFSEQLVVRFLEGRKGRAGAKIREIANATRTKYPTVHRIIKLLEKRGRVRQDEGSKWHLVTK